MVNHAIPFNAMKSAKINSFSNALKSIQQQHLHTHIIPILIAIEKWTKPCLNCLFFLKLHHYVAVCVEFYLANEKFEYSLVST